MGPRDHRVDGEGFDYREAAAVLYWFFKYILIGPWLRLLFRPQVEGLENIPKDGPVILASNHLSFSDSFFLPLMVPRHITFLAKAEYFNGTGLKGWFNRWFFSGVGQVPIDRSGVRPPTTPCTPRFASSARTKCSESIPKAPVRRMAACTAVRPGLRGWHWRPTCP